MRAVPARRACGRMFSGHEHNFQHSQVDGIDYFVSGAGAKVRRQAPNDFESARTISWSGECHFLVVTIDGDRHDRPGDRGESRLEPRRDRPLHAVRRVGPPAPSWWADREALKKVVEGAAPSSKDRYRWAAASPSWLSVRPGRGLAPSLPGPRPAAIAVIYFVPIYGRIGQGAQARQRGTHDPGAPRGTRAPWLRPRPPDRRALARRDQLPRRLPLSHALSHGRKALSRAAGSRRPASAAAATTGSPPPDARRSRTTAASGRASSKASTASPGSSMHDWNADIAAASWPPGTARPRRRRRARAACRRAYETARAEGLTAVAARARSA